MARLLDLTKKLFNSSRQEALPYKYYHFLNTINQELLEQILLFSEWDHLPKILPDFEAKKILFFNDLRHKLVLKKILAKEPKYFLSYIYKGLDAVNRPHNTKYLNVAGGLTNLAIKDESFDLVICPFVLNTEKADDVLIKKISAVVKNGGRLILSLRHMQLEHMLYNQNPSQTGALDNRISLYYQQLKANDLYLEDMTEGLVDKNLRPLFCQGEMFDYYQDYKNAPLTLLLRAVKYIKK